MMQLTGKKFVFESVEPVLAPDASEKSKQMLTFFVMMAQEIWKDVTLCFCEDGTLTAQGGGIGADCAYHIVYGRHSQRPRTV